MADLVKSGVQTAPTAGTAIATLTAPPAGNYDIEVEAMVSNAAVADLDNMKLTLNNADFSNPIPVGASGAAVKTTFNVDLNGVNDVIVKAVGNATAAILYEATIRATLKQRS